MFKISKEHMDAQSEAVRQGFEDRLIEFLHGEFPESKQEPIEDLRAVVREQVERALKYGLESEQHVAIYITTAWLLGRDFDAEFSAARDILTSPRRTADDKADDLSRFAEHLFVALEEEG